MPRRSRIPNANDSFQMSGNQHNLGNLSSPHHLIMEQVTCTMPTLGALKITVKFYILG